MEQEIWQTKRLSDLGMRKGEQEGNEVWVHPFISHKLLDQLLIKLHPQGPLPYYTGYDLIGGRHGKGQCHFPPGLQLHIPNRHESRSEGSGEPAPTLR